MLHPFIEVPSIYPWLQKSKTKSNPMSTANNPLSNHKRQDFGPVMLMFFKILYLFHVYLIREGYQTRAACTQKTCGVLWFLKEAGAGLRAPPHYSSQQALRTSGAGHPQGGADTHGGPSEGPGGLPETQLPVPGETRSGWVAARCCGRRVTWMAVLVPRLHTASSLRTPRTRRWLGFTATQRKPSRSGWSSGSKAQGGGQDPGRGLAGRQTATSSLPHPGTPL